MKRFANLVGRENVLAGADCGFSSQATYSTEVHPTVVWAKFEGMREGARLATRQLWSRADSTPEAGRISFVRRVDFRRGLSSQRTTLRLCPAPGSISASGRVSADRRR